MQITQLDLKDIDTHGLEYEWNDVGGIEIDLPNIKIWVEKRPFYCDRGRFGFWSEVKEGCHHKLTIDFSNAFPRYFFKLQRAFDELNDWIEFNKEKIHHQS